MRREGEKTAAIEAAKPPSQDRADVPEREHELERVPEHDISLVMEMER